MFYVQCRELFLNVNTDVFSRSHAYNRSVAVRGRVRFGMWVTDPDIKECLSLVLPESTCMDIQSRILRLY